MNRFHSVVLDEELCKGCTVCVTGCPTEAIRVRNGKARITSERCIDCGECIRRCPHRAKKAQADSFAAFPGAWRDRFDLLVALPAPSLYGQFPPKFTIRAIHEGLLALGFDAVFPVAAATPGISAAERALLGETAANRPPRPLVSSSCPTVVKYVQIRVPTLLENLATVISPMELAGRMAKRYFSGGPLEGCAPRESDAASRIGCFFVSPCAGKITEAVAPNGDETSSIDAVFPMNDVHLPLLQTILRNAKGIDSAAKPPAGPASHAESPLPGAAVAPSVPRGLPSLPTAAEISWGRAGGEADATIEPGAGKTLAVDGMDQCVKILEAAEDGKLSGIDFLELMACPGGCTGGPLTACNTALARHHLRERERELARDEASARGSVPAAERASRAGPACEACYRTAPFPARPALRLDPDFPTAMAMMQRMDEIRAKLPGLDCGCCGAPNCQALAEDIVRGTASTEDCVIILKEEYRELLEQRWQSGE